MKTLHMRLASTICLTMLFMLTSCAVTPYFSIYRPNDITVQNMSTEQAAEVLTNNVSKMQIAVRGDQQWSNVTKIMVTDDMITFTNGSGVNVNIVFSDIVEISSHGNLISIHGTSTFLDIYSNLSIDYDNITSPATIANALYRLKHNKRKNTV